MLKNKILSKKAKLYALSTVLGVATLASVATMTGCSTSQNSKDFVSPDNGYSMYSKITFQAPATPAGVTFSGSTVVKIKTGHLFGTVSHPTPVLDGYQLTGWINTSDSSAVTNSTPISGDVVIEPVMTPIGTNVSITGRKTIYNGVLLDNQGELLDVAVGKPNAYVYDIVCTEELLPTDQVSIEENAGGNALDITQPQQGSTTFYINPKFTEVSVSTSITATITRGATQIGTAVFPIEVKPPFYCTEEVHWGIDDSLDLGDGIWTVYESNDPTEDDSWVCSTFNEMCWTGNIEQDAQIIYYDFSDGKNVSTKYIARNDSSTPDPLKAQLTKIYPGAEIYFIADEFLAETNYYNPEICGGIHDINLIGNSFMRDCTSYNQNINELFTTTMDAMAIGNFFLMGCTSFNNGDAETFSMPKARVIGHGFMADCTSFEFGVEINEITEYIGTDFMADCTSVESLTIPSTSQLKHFGGNIMTNCENLQSITIHKGNINFLDDISDEGQVLGSFTVDNNTCLAYINGVTVSIDDSGLVPYFITNLYGHRDVAPYRNLIAAE